MSPLKGPQVKFTDVKAPDFVLDVYHDLKAHHLLPLVAILLVAIVAVPIALSQSSSSSEPDVAAEIGATASASGLTGQATSSLVVAKATPGLRVYRRRLGALSAKDPFKQQFGGKEAGTPGAGSTNAESSTPAVEATLEPVSPPSSGGGESSPPSSPPSSSTGPGGLTFFSYAIDVRIVSGGSPGGGKSAGRPATGSASASSAGREATVRRNLPELTMLPDRHTPAVIYMGSTKDGKKALLLVSSDVQSTFGDGVCVLGSQTCDLLAVEPGVPQTFVYGGQGKTFKIELLKIHLVTTEKLDRAPLGKPQKKNKRAPRMALDETSGQLR